MDFSERERRILEQLESSLHEDDPELDAKMKPTDRSAWTTRRVHVAGVIVSVGLLVMVCGVGFGNIWVGALGFLAMLGGTICIAPSQPRGSVNWPRLTRDHGDQ